MVLFVVPPGRLNGGALRYERIGHELMASVRVEFAVPRDVTLDFPASCVHAYDSARELRALAESAAVAVIPARLADAMPSLTRAPGRLVIDLAGSRTLGRAGLEAAEFFLCASEQERDAWLPQLLAHRPFLAPSRQPRRVRRLVDVIDSASLDPRIGCGERERAVDPLRLYCTSTVRQPREWAWAPPSTAGKALHVLREAGVRELAARVWSRWKKAAGSTRPADPAATLDCTAAAARLSDATSIDELHALLARHGIVGGGRRFMDLEIDITNRCNIRCRMCYFSFDQVFHARSAHLEPATFARVADAVLPHAKTVMLSLGSEPLLSPHFARILDLTARHRVPEVGFYTNGLLLTDRIIDAVVERGVTLVAISIDGATKATFETIRRGADFEVLLRNVRALARRRAATRHRRPRIRFGVVMMRQNIEELPDIVTLAWRLGVEELNFFHAVVYDGLGMEDQSLVHHKALSNEYLGRAQARARELGLTITHNPNPFDLAHARDARPAAAVAATPTPYCRFPFFHVSIDSHGKVMPCPFAHGTAPFGVVTPETPFEAIWLGREFTDLRRRILTNDPPGMCRRCSYLASSYPDRAELFDARPN